MRKPKHPEFVPDVEAEIDLDAKYHWEVKKIVIGPKRLKIMDKDYKADTGGGCYISFDKNRFIDRDWLEVTTSRSYEETVEKVCSLGHKHTLKQCSQREWQHLSIPWEHVETLIEWLQSGSWKQVRGNRQ